MSSRLQRLLYEPDTEEWKRYQRKWLVETANYYKGLVFVLVIGILGSIILLYFQINSNVPKGIPEGYRIISFQEVYPFIIDLLATDGQDVHFREGYIAVFPDWSHRRYPSARLVFDQEGSREAIPLHAIAEQNGYKFELLGYSPKFGFADQYREYQQLDEYLSPQIVNNEKVFQALQDSWGNKVLLENKHVSWPASLYVKNISEEEELLHLEWQLCYWVGLVTPGKQVCSPTIISSGTQLASP